jgi:hypothetical protein
MFIDILSVVIAAQAGNPVTAAPSVITGCPDRKSGLPDLRI